MSTRKIHFPTGDGSAFIKEVRVRVTDYFKQTGLSQKANTAMVVKTVIILAVTFGSYALILTGWFSPWQMLGLAILMGAGVAGMGFSVAHDALHGAYSSNPTVNKWLGYTFDLVGANGYMWKITHNVIHHTYTNIEGVDEDLTVSPILRLSPESPLRWYHRFQHIYGIAAYGFATLNWIFVKDFQQFLKKDIGPYKDKKHPRSEVIHLIWTKLAVYGYMIVLPLILLDITWWQFVIGFVAMHFTAGIILGVIFQLAHVVEGTEFLKPDDKGDMEYAWLLHEMHTTSNFAADNKPLSWYIGGLNYQIEHHLFPQVCSIHYPEISRIVRATAEEHGVPYHYQPTLMSAIRSHVSMLRQFGRPEKAPVPATA
jgi:linoleoyl-CoA desaturase